MTDRQALLSAAGKQRPYKAVNIKPPAMPGDIYFACARLLVECDDFRLLALVDAGFRDDDLARLF